MVMSEAATETPAAHVEVTGEGKPLMLLHGWGASAELFGPVVRALQTDRKLILPDLPGFGATPPPPAPWAARDYAEWTAALLDRLGVERADVIGHSNGGRIALVLAATHPDRVGKMVLTGSAGIRPRHGPRYHARVRTYKVLRAMGEARALPAALRNAARARAEQRGSEDYRAATGTMRGTLVRLVNDDLHALLPRVAAPVLLIWGDKDVETPLADGRTMERLIRDAGLVIFEGAGHYAYLEQPARFSRIVDVFLKQPTT
jgi:pimeloyl-ACP methyl ester carboxylesterase